MKNLILTTCLICLSVMSQAQDAIIKKDNNQQNESLYIKLKDGASPDVYIDGKKYDSAIVDLLDPDKIESITVIKGEQAIKEYNAKNGVLVISTKKKTESNIFIKENRVRDEKMPKVIIDDKLSDKEGLSKLSPDNILSIDVIKGETAEKEYGSPNGVIIVTTKKSEK